MGRQRSRVNEINEMTERSMCRLASDTAILSEAKGPSWQLMKEKAGCQWASEEPWLQLICKLLDNPSLKLCLQNAQVKSALLYV